MHAVGDLDIADIQRVFTLNPLCGEDRGGPIYPEFVFGVVKYLDPRLVSRESYGVRDTLIQVGKWPLWSKWPGEESFLSFWNGLIEDEPWLVEHFFDQVIHSDSRHVSDGYTLPFTPIQMGISIAARRLRMGIGNHVLLSKWEFRLQPNVYGWV